jgi:hypothetical protein
MKLENFKKPLTCVKSERICVCNWVSLYSPSVARIGESSRRVLVVLDFGGQRKIQNSKMPQFQKNMKNKINKEGGVRWTQPRHYPATQDDHRQGAKQYTKQSSPLPMQVFKHSYTRLCFKVMSERFLVISVGHPGNRTHNVQITSLAI